VSCPKYYVVLFKDNITHFIAYLSLQGLSFRTAQLYNSAIGYKCKVSGYPDVTQQSHYCREIASAISLFLPSMCRARNIMLFCNVYNINGRISAMTRLDLEVCVFTISWDRFRRLAPQAQANPREIPDHIRT
jgi:hypothetical protein